MQITDEMVFAAMEAGGAEARAWSTIERGDKVLVHDLKRGVDLVHTIPDDNLPDREQHVMDDRASAMGFVTYRTYAAAIKAAFDARTEHNK